MVAHGDTVDYILHGLQGDVKLYVAEWGHERIFLHAGVVGWEGRAILLPGHTMRVRQMPTLSPDGGLRVMVRSR